MSRPRRALAAVAAAGAVALTGCGLEERIVHLQPAPTENAEVGAPLRTEAAEQIAARVLAQAADAEDQEQREATYVGPALRVAALRTARGVLPEVEAVVTAPQVPTVLAMSRGQSWPRAMLVATLDSDTQTQHVHVLVSSGPTDQFAVHATAPMLPGAAVPALGDPADGTTYAVATQETPIEGSAVIDEYARGLAFPDPAETTLVALDDAFAESLTRNTAEQDEAFDDLATLTRSHAPIANSVVSFETADGGRVIFGQMVREAVITLTDEAKELKIEDETLQELSGKEVVTESFTARYLENVLFVAPPQGLAQIIGAEEIVIGAEGS